MRSRRGIIIHAGAAGHAPWRRHVPWLLLVLLLVLLQWRIPTGDAFLLPGQGHQPWRHPADGGGSSISTASSRHRPSTRRYSDAFFNFEALKRRFNLTHFGDPALDNAPPLPEEDFKNRPDLVKAREIAATIAAEFSPDEQLASVALYFHVAHHHLQSYREALEAFVAEQEAKYGGKNEVFWEAFQLIGLPAALDGTRYPGSQAGRVPSRSRLLLCGTFRDAEAEARAKREVGQWREALRARLRAYRLGLPDDEDGGSSEEDDLVETMPLSQAVYRRVLPSGPQVEPAGGPAAGRPTPSSVFLLAFLQSSWSSERKVRAHRERVLQYVREVTASGQAIRAEFLQDPDYPSAQRIWHHFADEDALVACLAGSYADLLQEGAKFRARVNHVEQAFAPLVPARATVLARPLASSGAWMPLVGYGTAVYRGREREGALSVEAAVRVALRAGARLLDCSPDYGTQPAVGAAVREALAAGELRRDHLFVVSSLSAATTAGGGGGAGAAVRAEVERTLAELGSLAYLDALLLPYQEGLPVVDLWQAMEALVDAGLVRHLGVAGFPLEALAALDADPRARRRPDLLLTEHHPFYRDEALLDYCAGRPGAGPIQVVAHTPLGRPAASRPPGTHILREPLVAMSAEALECSAAQVALRWAVQQGVAVVPNSLRRRHILANACLHAFTMAPFRLDVLNEMSAVRDCRFADPVHPPAPPPAPLAEVAAQGIVYTDDGAVIPPGTDVEYMELTVEVFDRLDLGDVAELLVEPREIAGVFPGMDVEPIE